MSLFHLFSSEFPNDFKVKKGLEILGIEKEVTTKTGEFLIDKIIKYMFDMKIDNNEKSFDIEQDFKYYYYDFYKLGIDLLKENPSWFVFNSILNGLFLDKDSSISKVIQYRLYKKPTKNPKVAEQEEHKYYMEMKRIYRLEQEKIKVDENLNRLWNYIEKKVGEENE